VVIGTGAVVLGDITIGDGARIGSGSVVIKSVPPGAVVVGIPGRVVEEHGEHLLDLEHGRLPDPVAEAIRLVLREQTRLEGLLEKVERQAGITTPRDEIRQRIKEIMDEFGQGG
jgi:serine O-acetyltransferase